MAIQFSENQRKYYKDLRDNFNKHVEEYKKEKQELLKQGKADELKEELAKHKGYLELFQKGDVADIEINIRFLRAKIKVLEEILK